MSPIVYIKPAVPFVPCRICGKPPCGLGVPPRGDYVYECCDQRYRGTTQANAKRAWNNAQRKEKSDA